MRKIMAFIVWAVPMAAVLFLSSCGEGCNNTHAVYYTLTVLDPLNGSVSVDPVRANYREGSTVYLTTAPDDGYDFYSWTGDSESRENPLPLVMDSDKTVGADFTEYTVVDYYVDYDSGDDANSGTSESSPWKHSPGDDNAEGAAAACVLGPGSRVLFRGGVAYRGQINIPADGAFNHHVIYEGSAWPEGQKAIIDGGDVITGWAACSSSDECFGNEHYASLYYAHVSPDFNPLSLNLHEVDPVSGDDEFLWLAQDPAPADAYFYDEADDYRTVTQENLTRTSLVDTANFTQADPSYWGGSYVLVWVNPNIVVTRQILSYEPAESRITFEDLGENAIYPDGRDQYYAIYNSPHALDEAGEYFVCTTPDENGLKILLWPRSASDLDSRISASVRNYGFNINARNNLTIQGFSVRKHAGTGLRDGVGIGTVSAAHIAGYNLVIRDNYITHNQKNGTSGGYGGIFIGQCFSCMIEENEIVENPRHSGIFLGGGARNTVRDNIITRSGGTSLRLYGVEKSQVLNNTITDSNGSHANGITLYLGCGNVLVANNRVLDCASPITFQDSGNLWFVNNLVDAYDRGSNVNEWGDTSHGPWVRGVIGFFNNTLVRNNRNASLNIGDNPGDNTYYSINNIIDGGGSADCISRSNNLYTGLSWSQHESYGWSLADEEVVQENLAAIFSDPAGLLYTILGTGPAAGGGMDVTSLLPVDLFPEFDFSTDIDGNTRDTWDMGAYAY